MARECPTLGRKPGGHGGEADDTAGGEDRREGTGDLVLSGRVGEEDEADGEAGDGEDEEG